MTRPPGFDAVLPSDGVELRDDYWLSLPFGAGLRGVWRRAMSKWAARLALGGLVVLVLTALLAPAVISALGLPSANALDPSSLDSEFGMPTGPSAEHWLGVDGLGRDVLSRTIQGARVSLAVALASTAITLVIGVTLGLVAGFRGGWLDTLISRMAEAALVIPYILLAVGLAASCSREGGCVGGTIRPGVSLVVLVIAVTSWPLFARVARSQTLVLRQSEFVAAARVAGIGQARVIGTEILPNLWTPIVVFALILIPQTMLAEAALSFLGVGVPPATPTWGGMIAEAAPYFPDAWWLMLLPGLALLGTVLVCVVLADALRGHSGTVPR